MSAADRLREAARVLRERAEAATPGPWVDVPDARPYIVAEDSPPGYWVDIAEQVGTESDATYIATMHPGVALALADWLDAEAAVLGLMQPMAELISAIVEQEGGPAGYVRIVHDEDGNPQMQADSSPAALRVAEAILGSAS